MLGGSGGDGGGRIWEAAGTTAFLALFVSLVWYVVLRTPRVRRHGIPLRKPPDTLPLLGNGIQFLQARHKLLTWFAACQRQHGYETLQLSVPTLPPGVIISDPQNLDFVFKNEGIFGKGDFVRGALWDLFGYGIINADGDLWKRQRKAGLHFLSNANLRVLTDIALPDYLSQSIETLARIPDTEVVDLQVVFHEITSQLMGKMAYNMEMHTDDAFTKAFDFASGAVTERFQNPLWRITDIFTGSKLRAAIGVVKAYGQEIVAAAVRDRDMAKDSKKQSEVSVSSAISGSLIQSLLASIRDHRLVADAALNYLSAGRDTTAQALTWTFYALMRHPSAVARIREEVAHLLLLQQQQQQQQPRHHSSDQNSHPPGPRPSPTVFTPSSMPYTLAVFYESLRLYPPVPVEIKQALAAVTLPDGTHLPRSSVLVWCPWAMNRSRETWGADADDFRPARWLLGEGSLEGERVAMRPASEYPVFNGGARTCLGKKMAEAIAVQVIAAVVWAFDVEPAFEGERVSRTSLTLPMDGGLPCYVRRRVE